MKRALAVLALLTTTLVATPGVASAADASYRTLGPAHQPDWLQNVPDAKRGRAGPAARGGHPGDRYPGPGAKMYVNFGSGSSIFAQPQQLAGGAYGVRGVDPFLLIYLNEGHGLTRTGMVLLDFPGSGLIEKIISYNRVFSSQV